MSSRQSPLVRGVETPTQIGLSGWEPGWHAYLVRNHGGAERQEGSLKEAAMVRLFTVAMVVAVAANICYPNGVAIVDAHNGVYLRLDSSVVTVSVQSQISVTTTTQYFTNRDSAALVKFGFPLSESASAVQLRWMLHGRWYTASVSGNSQDTTLPGPGMTETDLISYLGRTPLYFPIPDSVGLDSSLVVELTYVELLPYLFGRVSYSYPNDYHLIQSGTVQSQRFEFRLESPRSIDSLEFAGGQPVDRLVNYKDSAYVRVALNESKADRNYAVNYVLNSNELGLFAYSTMLPDSEVPDSLGNGFLTFIAEPDPGTQSGTISKVFTLIIDRSGSMSGTKMVQAREAASFIVNNLSDGDRFNLVDFDDQISSFRPGHVAYTMASRDSALAYIQPLYARGSTSISGALGVAVPQFAAANDSTANIIIFFTDGQATSGITNTELLVHYVDSLIVATETNIYLFSFGIGNDANQQLLSLLSDHNRGLAGFLGNDELYSRITSFYTLISKPVLLNSSVSFVPPVVEQTFPDSLPNLYKGRQMIIAGRYSRAEPVQITLAGNALGKPVSYAYTVQLAGDPVVNRQFLPKVWAKRKIESLLVKYYIQTPNSEAANSLKEQIVALSRAYGVISPFTSFENDPTQGGTIGVSERNVQPPNTVSVNSFELLGNYPNPFNPSTTIRVKLNLNYSGTIAIRIYNVLGQVVRVIRFDASGAGVYDVRWDGRSASGRPLPSGIYFYAVEFRDKVLVGKMNLVK